MDERVERLKKEFERFVTRYNIHEYDVHKIFREWVFVKLAKMEEKLPKPDFDCHCGVEHARIDDAPFYTNTHYDDPTSKSRSVVCDNCGKMVEPGVFAGTIYSPESNARLEERIRLREEREGKAK